MKDYIKNSIQISENCTVITPYNTYEFNNEEELQEFLDYLDHDPDYADPELQDIIEWLFFYEKENM